MRYKYGSIYGSGLKELMVPPFDTWMDIFGLLSIRERTNKS